MDAKRVFINCPFDEEFKGLFDAILFTVLELGFEPRHALIDDSEALRLKRIVEEISKSKYSIHDLSRVELSKKSKLPRFNMPFEAGLAYMQHELSLPQDKHHILILDAKPFRFHASLSDAAGLDAKIHAGSPQKAIEAVRQFLATKSQAGKFPGGSIIAKRYALFLELLKTKGSNKVSLTEIQSWNYVNDLQAIMVSWIDENPIQESTLDVEA
ncbi:hypothetical protein [Xanthomonas sacchari]|uniref:hypothetical protein n=1 Tax=Xanthomonas sacchari TaxID=56458 RepID=UPI002255A1A6|nr:hypothetical protein [Xanthomonas sacchari]